MDIIMSMLNLLNSKLSNWFIDHDTVQRFFRIEYGQDADAAYTYWTKTRGMYEPK